MTVASPERLRGDLVRLAHRGGGLREFSSGAAGILARAVPCDGVCVLTLDPATLLMTGEVIENGLTGATAARMIEIELGGQDVNPFAVLARAARPAASMSEATHGDLDRSLRYRELKRPNGFGDDLRAALVTESVTWGALTLLRARDREHFTTADVSLVASVTGYLAEGLRRAMLLTAVAAERAETDASHGLAMLAADNTITVADATARMWLAELGEAGGGEPLPPVVTAVAARARSIVTGRAPSGAVARARVRTASGRWLLVRGSTFGEAPDAQTAVMLEPARPHELAPLIADAYGLTERERAVTGLVAQGLPTGAIARRLHLSPWTVQDHLKSIFDKLGVSTRGQLVARLFFEHHAPRLAGGAPLGPDGSFAPSPAAASTRSRRRPPG